MIGRHSRKVNLALGTGVLCDVLRLLRLEELHFKFVSAARGAPASTAPWLIFEESGLPTPRHASRRERGASPNSKHAAFATPKGLFLSTLAAGRAGPIGPIVRIPVRLLEFHRRSSEAGHHERMNLDLRTWVPTR